MRVAKAMIVPLPRPSGFEGLAGTMGVSIESGEIDGGGSEGDGGATLDVFFRGGGVEGARGAVLGGALGVGAGAGAGASGLGSAS